MSIRPVSGVSFSRNFNQINFEGKDKGKSYTTSSFTNTLKSIPLAAIIAMSPMVAQAQTRADHINEKVVTIQNYGDPYAGGCNVFWISNDGNDDDAERLALQHGKKAKFNKTVNGQDIPVIKRTVYKQYVDNLKKVNVTYRYEDGRPDEKTILYYVDGPRTSITTVERADNKKPLSKNEGYSQKEEYRIDKDLYDYLSQYYSADSFKNENKIVVIKDSDVMDYFN